MEHTVLNVGPRLFEEMSRRVEKSPGEIVMVVRRPHGKVLLMTKDFYPPDIYRLPTGKMKHHEVPDQAVLRELHEETGFTPESVHLLDVISTTFVHNGESVDYCSHIFVTPEITGEPEVLDTDEGITDFHEVDDSRLHDVAEQLQALPESWSDWGKWRAITHDFVWRKLCPA